MAEQQKVKVAAMTPEEQKMFDEMMNFKVPVDMSLSKDGQFDYTWSLETRAKFLIYKFKLDPNDLYIDRKANSRTGQVKEVIVIKAAGWYKVAHQDGWNKSQTTMQNTNPAKDGFAVFKAQVGKKGIECLFDGTGYCGRDENGKQSWAVPAFVGTAETRAVVRAIRFMCPISGVLSEDDKNIIESGEMDKAFNQIPRAEHKPQPPQPTQTTASNPEPKKKSTTKADVLKAEAQANAQAKAQPAPTPNPPPKDTFDPELITMIKARIAELIANKTFTTEGLGLTIDVVRDQFTQVSPLNFSDEELCLAFVFNGMQPDPVPREKLMKWVPAEKLKLYNGYWGIHDPAPSVPSTPPKPAATGLQYHVDAVDHREKKDALGNVLKEWDVVTLTNPTDLSTVTAQLWDKPFLQTDCMITCEVLPYGQGKKLRNVVVVQGGK